MWTLLNLPTRLFSICAVSSLRSPSEVQLKSIGLTSLQVVTKGMVQTEMFSTPPCSIVVLDSMLHSTHCFASVPALVSVMAPLSFLWNFPSLSHASGFCMYLRSIAWYLSALSHRCCSIALSFSSPNNPAMRTRHEATKLSAELWWISERKWRITCCTSLASQCSPLSKQSPCSPLRNSSMSVKVSSLMGPDGTSGSDSSIGSSASAFGLSVASAAPCGWNLWRTSRMYSTAPKALELTRFALSRVARWRHCSGVRPHPFRKKPPCSTML